MTARLIVTTVGTATVSSGFVREGKPTVSFRFGGAAGGGKTDRLALAAEARLRYQERRVQRLFDRACHGGRSNLPDVPWRLAEAAIEDELLGRMALGLGQFAKRMGR